MRWPDDRVELCRRFHDQGFVIVSQFLAADKVNEVRSNLDRYVADKVPTLDSMDVFCEDRTTRRQIRMLPRMQEHDEYFAGILTSGPLRELAEDLCGTGAVPRDAAWFNKLPEIGEATPPHQDGYYFHLDPCEALTLWLALDDVDEENACVRYVPGSHRRGMRPHGRTQVLGFSQGITDYSDLDREAEIAACVVPGDVIAHHAMTIHRTDANLSSRSRRAIGFVYFSSDARIDEAARDRYQQQLKSELSAEGKI